MQATQDRSQSDRCSSGTGLPEGLRKAQSAIDLPEVQEMIRRLGDYNLGVFMPHMHDERGAFLELPEDVVQIEEGLEVSFRPGAESAADPERYVPIGWAWRGDGPTAMAMCVMKCVKDNPTDTMHYSQHKKED